MDFGSSHVYAGTTDEEIGEHAYYASVPRENIENHDKLQTGSTNSNLDPIYEAIEIKGKPFQIKSTSEYDEVPSGNNDLYSEVSIEGHPPGPQIPSKPTMYKNATSLSDKLRDALSMRDAKIRTEQISKENEEYSEVALEDDPPPPIPSRSIIDSDLGTMSTILTPVAAPAVKQLRPKMSKRAASVDSIVPVIAPPPSVPRRRTFRSQTSEDQISASSQQGAEDLQYLESVRQTIQNIYHVQPKQTPPTPQTLSTPTIFPPNNDFSKTNPFSLNYESPSPAWDSIDNKPRDDIFSGKKENDANNNTQTSAAPLSRLYPTLPNDIDTASLFSGDSPVQSLQPTAPMLTSTMVRKDAAFLRGQLQSLIESEHGTVNSISNPHSAVCDVNNNIDEVTPPSTLLRSTAPSLSQSMIRRDINGRSPVLKRSNSQESIYSSADTNVVSIQLGIVSQNQGSYFCEVPPEKCVLCSGITNNITEKWTCTFCGSENKSTSLSTVPQNSASDVTYVLRPPVSRPFFEDSLIVFCIDTSGSMCVTSKIAHGGQGEIFVSRLQSVQQAISEQINCLEKTRPYCRVAIIAFGNNAELLGDGSPEQYFSLSDMQLFDYDYVSKIGRSTPLPGLISDKKTQLNKTIAGLKEKGGTALGPALLLSTALASQRPGSQVIVCTDGRANVGIGSLEQEDDYQICHHFYDQTSQLASKHGVIVSIMSISGTDCRLVELGKVANRTAGKVSVVEANNLSAQFQDMLADQVLATNVTIALVTHKQLYFSKAEGAVGSEIEEFIGNITSDSEVTFRYGIKKDGEHGLHPPPKTAPFQLKIEYRGLDGSMCMRVLTQVRPVTENRQLAESEMNVAVIGTYATQSAAKLALEGELDYAKEVTAAHKQLLQRGRSLRSTTTSVINSRENELIYESVQSQIEEIGNELCKADSSSSADDLSSAGKEQPDEEKYEEVGRSADPGPALPPRSYITNAKLPGRNPAAGGAKVSGIGAMSVENVLAKLPSFPKTTLIKKKNKKKKAMSYKDSTAEKMFSFSKATSQHLLL